MGNFENKVLDHEPIPILKDYKQNDTTFNIILHIKIQAQLFHCWVFIALGQDQLKNKLLL